MLSAIHRIQLFPRIFKYLPFDYRAKNDIYSYIYWCFTPLTTWTSIDMFIIHTCFGEALFSLMKKKTKKQQEQQTNHGVQTIECSCLLLQSIVYDQMEEKLSNKLPAPILKDFRLENIDCTKYQLIFVTAEEILSKTFFSS